MADRLIAHLGLPMAAPTALQSVLTAKAAEIGYLGKYHGKPEEKLKPFRTPALHDTIRMAAALYDVRAIDGGPAQEAVRQAAEHFGTDRLTLSDEGLSSAGFSHRGAARGIAQILTNLGAMSGLPVEPVIVLREQRSFLRSYHAQLILGGYRLDFGEFVALVLQRKYSWLSPVLDYSRFCGTARDICGTAHIAAMEQIVADDGARADFLDRALGADFSAVPFPVIRPGREPAELVHRLRANRRMQGRLDRTIAEFIETRYIPSETDRASEALNPPLDRLVGRQNDAIRHWSGQSAQSVRSAEDEDAADHLLLRLPPALGRALETHIRDWNAHLPSVAPGIPWHALGYLL